MHRYKKAALLILLLVAAMGVMAATIRQQDKQKKDAVADEPARADVGEFPVAEFDAPAPADAKERDKRRKRNARYAANNELAAQVFRLGEDSQEVRFALGTIEQEEAMNPLPVIRGGAVVIGDVTDAHAFVSTDKTGVYSEFTINIEQVLMEMCDPCPEPLRAGAFISAERRGGAVRLPSGKVLSRGHALQGLPRVKRRYVFFLEVSEEGDDFSIIGGYELRGDKVFPLDGVSHPTGRKREIVVVRQFAPYVCKDQAEFMGELREAIARVKKAKQAEGSRYDAKL